MVFQETVSSSLGGRSSATTTTVTQARPISVVSAQPVATIAAAPVRTVVAQPVAVNVETFGTETIDNEDIQNRVKSRYDLSPAGIIKHLNLLNTTYLPTARNGHFGNPAFPWESTKEADILK